MMEFGGNRGPAHCAYCKSAFEEGAPYLRVALAVDRAGTFLEIPPLLMGYEFCSPLHLMYWGEAKLPEVLLDSEVVREEFGAGRW